MSDNIILIMGPTGSGKTNFINSLISGKGKKPESRTQDIRETIANTSKGRYMFVDTPGFDDTYRSDYDILQTIAGWLEEKYRGQVKINGIIYMHRITDNRMTGTVSKNLDMFGRLCGDRAAKRVRMVTTMWDKAKDRNVAETRASELENKFWKPLIDEGARHHRFRNTRESAWNIIHDATGNPEALLLQEELVDTEMRLNETIAGKALYSQYQKCFQTQKETMKQLLDEAKMQQDPAMARELQGEYKRIKALLEKMREEMEKLKIPLARQVQLKVSFKKPRSHPIPMDLPV